MCVHRESGAQRAVKVLRKSHMDEDEKRAHFNEITRSIDATKKFNQQSECRESPPSSQHHMQRMSVTFSCFLF